MIDGARLSIPVAWEPEKGSVQQQILRIAVIMKNTITSCFSLVQLLTFTFLNQSVMGQDFPPNPVLKNGYQLEFNEDFTSSELDTNKWFPYYLPQWSSKAKSATNYQIKNNTLILKIDEDQEPWCPEFNDSIKVSSLQTGVFSGELNSSFGQHRISENCVVREQQQVSRLYTPQYGYFEIRAKAIGSKNNVCAFWMIGFEDEPYKSAEICIMEIKGEHVKEGQAVNGFGLRAFEDTNLADEFFEEPFSIDATQFHIYAAEWKPSGIDFFIDNKKVKSIRQSPAYEMQFMLNIYEVPINLALNKPELTYPKVFQIDYVRAYQPLAGYLDNRK